MRRQRTLSWSLAGLVLCGFAFRSLAAEDNVELARSDRNQLRTAKKIITLDRAVAERHALWPALELAVDCYTHIRRDVRDYSCQVVRRERIHGKLQPREFMAAKVRHARTRQGKTIVPFSVYLKVLAPDRIKGREILFVSGQHDGDMIVRNGGKRFAFVTTKIRPTSDTAMADNRYPLTEFGFENLVRRLIDVVKEEIRIGAESEVQFFNDAKVDGRRCTGVVVSHPTYDSRLRFYRASVFMDNELRVPVHYEAYDWPEEADGEPILLEQYTYRDIRLNVRFTDEDFDRENPRYKLR